MLQGTYTWDMGLGAQHVAISKQTAVRCVQNGVLYIRHWASGKTQSANDRVAKITASGSVAPLQLIGPYRTAADKKARTIVLDREYNAGEAFEYLYQYDAIDTFPDDREWIAITVETVTDSLKLEVIWPDDRTVNDVELTVGKAAPVSVVVETDPETRRKRTCKTLGSLNPGDNVRLAWAWV